MTAFWQFFRLFAPLFAIVFAGYALASWRWRREWTALLSKFIFVVALPALLFHMVSGLRSLPPVDARLLIAFFGSCFAVFFIARIVAARCFGMDGVSQSIFALAGIFSNNVLLGLPIARLALGEASVPAVALVLVFNSLTLWTLVSISIEWARHGSFSPAGFGKTVLGVLKNPIVVAILAGVLVSAMGLKLPHWIGRTLDVTSWLAAPAALLVLGMGLVEYGIRLEWSQSLTICALKLVLQPLIVWAIAAALGLPPLETSVVVLLASMSTGVNVYLMATHFRTLQGTVASSLVLSTALAALTVPALLALLHTSMQ